MVSEGGSASLVCKARGYPKPHISWRRENNEEIMRNNAPGFKEKGKKIPYRNAYLNNIIIYVGNRTYHRRLPYVNNVVFLVFAKEKIILSLGV